MAIVTSNNKTPQKKAAPLSSEVTQQLDAVFTQATRETPVKAEKKKKERKYNDTFVINLPEGERNRFKSFCADHNISMTDYIYFCMDYIKEKTETGLMSVSRAGIKELKKETT